MSSNILITGAAGYIGGSIVADFLASNNNLTKKAYISAAVRSEEQANALSKLGIDIFQLDLTDEGAVVQTILQHNINIVIHTASSIDPSLALHLITALSKQKEVSGEDTYFIHGWAHFAKGMVGHRELFKDTGPIFDVEKQLADSFPIRKTDVTIVEHAKARGVTSFIVIPSQVYGKGSGIISCGTVYRFAENTKVSGVHISDLTALYGRIIEKILPKESIPNGIEGYYFALAHDLLWWEVLDHLAVSLKARSLITETKPRIWPSDEVAAEKLGVPVPFVQPLWNAGANIISENTDKIGWEPVWNKDLFLQNIDDEIKAVLELDKAKSSLIDSLFRFAA